MPLNVAMTGSAAAASTTNCSAIAAASRTAPGCCSWGMAPNLKPTADAPGAGVATSDGVDDQPGDEPGAPDGGQPGREQVAPPRAGHLPPEERRARHHRQR